MFDFIKNEIQKTAAILSQLEQNSLLQQQLHELATQSASLLKAGGKILFAGNGGSAADSQHLAAELVSRLRYDRPGLAAIALTTDTSALTAIGNDYAFEFVFSRQIESIGKKGDIFIGISTSGKSPNILRALEAARARQLMTVGLTGARASFMAERCDFVFSIPSTETPKIQECHILLGHILCALIEEEVYGAAYNPARQLSEEKA